MIDYFSVIIKGLYFKFLLMLRTFKSFCRKSVAMLFNQSNHNLSHNAKPKIFGIFNFLSTPSQKLSPHTQLLIKPQSSKYTIWLKRFALVVLCIYSLGISYAWYQNQKILENAGGYLSERLKKLQQLFSTESQKAKSVLAIEKTSQNYLLTEIKKLRQENLDLQKRLHFFEEATNPSSTNIDAGMDDTFDSLTAQLNKNIHRIDHENQNLAVFKVTKSQATLISAEEKIISPYYIPNHLFENLPQNILQIKAWLIQPNLKAFKNVPIQKLDIELELHYEINQKMVIQRYPENLVVGKNIQTSTAELKQQQILFKDFELNAYRAWMADVEIPKSAKIHSAQLVFRNSIQRVLLKLEIDT